ncbi:hypothetical protein [Butyricicoccus sp.]|uniref:hypothetical protein n=1 Tax=Butyricicoccus sp. TaxID=2049021 RepID=UPI003F1607DC
MIELGMLELKDPEEAYQNSVFMDGVYEQWAEDYFQSLVAQVAEITGADPEEIADKDRRTSEQQQALIAAAAREFLDRLDRYSHSNYIAAIKHINAYCIWMAEVQGTEDIYKPLRDERYPDALQDGNLVNVPLAAVLYFFATHEDIDPRAQDGLTAEQKAAITDVFTRLDAFYREHRAEINNGQHLLLEFAKADKTSPASAQETLQRICDLAIVPKRMVVPTHKLVNSLTRATRTPEDAIQIVLEVSKRGAKNKVTATCVLSYEGDDVKISGRQPFTEYDRNVYNAVVSLYVAGNRVITSDMVWRTMTGKTEQEQPSPALKAAVTKSIDKMRFMRAQIDCSDEFKMRRIELDGKPVNGAGFDDNLLHLSVTWVRAGKNTIRAYEFPKESRFAPILYQYSAAVKQVINVPIALLDVKKLDKHGKPTTHSLSYTEQRVIIKGYLLRRIEGMKGKNALKSRNIAFMDYSKDGQTHEGLYTVAGYPELSQPMPEGVTNAEKTKRKNDARYIREDAAAILGYWTASGYINGFSEYRDGRAVAGFEIKL